MLTKGEVKSPYKTQVWKVGLGVQFIADFGDEGETRFVQVLTTDGIRIGIEYNY